MAPLAAAAASKAAGLGIGDEHSEEGGAGAGAGGAARRATAKPWRGGGAAACSGFVRARGFGTGSAGVGEERATTDESDRSASAIKNLPTTTKIAEQAAGPNYGPLLFSGPLLFLLQTQQDKQGVYPVQMSRKLEI